MPEFATSVAHPAPSPDRVQEDELVAALDPLPVGGTTVPDPPFGPASCIVVSATSADASSVLGRVTCSSTDDPATGQITLSTGAGSPSEVGALLLSQLMDRARDAGYVRLIAEVLPGDRALRTALCGVRTPMSIGWDAGVRRVTLPLDPA